MMGENDGANFTPEDFDLICRVCLQYEEDMVDIFESGIVDQITKLTNLKVNVNDKLPKTLCQNCSIQLDLLFKFQEKAKTSDTFLKSVLKAKKDSEPKPLPIESIKKKKKPGRPKKRKKHVFSKKKKKLQKKEPDDKIYLVLVPKVDETDSEEKSDILIKDINYATDNSDDKEISDLCKNFLKDNALDQTCQQPFNDDIETQNNVVESEPQLEKNGNEDELENKGVGIQEGAGIQEIKQECPDEINEPEEVPQVPSVEDVKPEEILPLENIKSEKIEEFENVNPARIEPVYDPFGENRVLNINMVIFECGECNARFEEILDLKNHYIDLHGHEPLISPRSYKCPLCFYYGTGKDEFYAHLQNHKNEGFLFIKVNSEGDKIPVKENEGHVFADSNLKVKELCKIFKLNLEVFKCTVCNKELESKTLILDHIQKCSSKKKNTVKIYLKYTCPVCQISILNSENKFVDHLITHKAECVFYVKVDKTGKPVAVPNDDKLFIPLQEAEEIMKTLSKTSLVKISHVNNIYCCKTCNYVAQTYGLLSQHCSVVHGQLLLEPSIICPVCFEEFHKGNVDDRKNSLYQHLRVHRKKGIVFVEIKQDGSVSEFNEHYEDVFTYSSILCSLPNGFMSAGFHKVWSPEIIIYRRKSFSKYKCDMCKKRFKKKREISKHILSHQKHYICEKCGKSVTKLQYRSHILRHIESANKNKCTVCGKTFANKPSLHNHIRLHLEEGVEEEGECPQAGIICDECGKSFTNNSSLSKHKKKHATEKENALVKCEICGKEFIRQSSLVRHRAAHLDPKYFECEICKLPLPSTMTLRKHVELHKIRAANKTFDCDTCSISFLTKDSLRAHQSHTGHLIDRKPFECNVCKKKFDIGKKFAEHIKTHPKYKMGECTLCGKRLSTVQSLTMHMARHFGANGILCPHCGKQFFEDRNYRRHLLIHKGVKPHACEVEGCDKSFYTTFELNRHIKYHLNKRDFNCPYCSKSFHEANHLTVHVRTHTGERPYSCPHCDKSFVTRTRCKEHIKLIHQGIGYELIQSSISKKVTVFENEKKS